MKKTTKKLNKEPKLKALVIEPVNFKYDLVNLTEFMDDDRWICGLNEITSLEAVAERAAKERVPIWPRELIEKPQKNRNENSRKR